MSFVFALLAGDDPLARDDDFDGSIADVCRRLATTGARFLIAGFGRGPWPVDVGYDLPLAFEGIDNVLGSLAAGVESELTFWGQGIERTLTFRALENGLAEIKVASWGDWVPKAHTETIPTAVLEWMLAEVVRGVRSAGVELGLSDEWL